MRHLNKFYNYLNESTSLDKKEIEDNLLNLKDIPNLKFEYCEYTTDESNNPPKKAVYQAKLIYNNHNMKYLESDKGLTLTSPDRKFSFDETFWEILSEIGVIKDRLIDKYDIGFSIDQYGSHFIIYLCIVEK